MTTDEENQSPDHQVCFAPWPLNAADPDREPIFCNRGEGHPGQHARMKCDSTGYHNIWWDDPGAAKPADLEQA